MVVVVSVNVSEWRLGEHCPAFSVDLVKKAALTWYAYSISPRIVSFKSYKSENALAVRTQTCNAHDNSEL